MYCLGEEADPVLASTNIEDADRAIYDSVLGKFDSFCQVSCNVIFERARFNRRNQLDGESAESYIMELYKLVENCAYGALQSEMLRDHLVVGITDSSLSQRLQMDSTLTLDKAKKMIRQREAVHEQQQELKGVEPAIADELKTEVRHPCRRSATGRWHPIESKTDPRAKSCLRCGKQQHPREKCPAKDAECHKCNRKGHYSAQCFSKTIAELSHGSSTHEETAFLDAVSDNQQATWTIQIELDGQQTVFKIDTGAQVTAISETTWKHLGAKQLNAPTKVLYDVARKPLDVIGQFTGKLSHNNKLTTQTVFVVTDLQTNLLGLPTITALNLAARMDLTTAIEDEIRTKFPSVFTGLGNLGEEYEIQLKPDAVPYCMYAPRHVALPLRSQVQQELERMEAISVISKVDEPTAWCAGMVVVPKKSGSVRICVDLKLPFGISSAPEHFQKRMNKIENCGWARGGFVSDRRRSHQMQRSTTPD